MSATAELFQIRTLPLPGCVELLPRRLDDERGRFVKTFHRDAYRALGLATDFAEEYYSVSRRGVLRGLHFQRPPHEHAKLAYCVQGRIQDALVDLRVGSPAFGRHVTLELSSEAANLIYMPPGIAHGFCTLSEEAVVVYKVTSVHAPDADAGILWSSAGIPWAVGAPLLSARDQAHPTLAEFSSPFVFEAPR